MNKNKRFLATTSPDITGREIENALLSRRIAADGICLLENNGVLPLSVKTVALYGIGAVYTVKGGSGSGDVNPRYSVSVLEGLENAGVTVDNKSWLNEASCLHLQTEEKRKSTIAESVGKLKPFDFGGVFEICNLHPAKLDTCIPLKEEHISSAADTAICVISRQAGEGKDRRLEKGDYYLSDAELSLLKGLRSHYKALIVVINAGSMIDLSFTDEVDADALIYMCQAGMEGGNALADILTGNVNPSGRLSSTSAIHYEDYPNAMSYSYLDGDLENGNYSEGILVGYRHFTSKNIKSRYPFGYGLSYTTFRSEQIGFEVSETELTFSVRVTNMGSRTGKETVQLYASCPKGKIVKEAVRLVGFAKTKLLAPGEAEELTICIPIEALESFDAVQGVWFLEKGDYTFFLGKDCEKLFETVKWHSDGKVLLDTKKVLRQSFTVPECMKKMSEGELIDLVVGVNQAYQGGQFTSVPGAVGHAAIHSERFGGRLLTIADGPAGLRLQSEFSVSKSGRFSQKVFDEYIGRKTGWIRLVNTINGFTPKNAERHYQYATAWPVESLVAMTFDLRLVREMGKAAGREMKELGVDIWLAPGVNIHRNPLCGRNFEYYSEDPLLAGKMAASLIGGVQETDGCAVSIKHFACNNQEDNREHVSANVDERTLREIYLKPFEIAIKESKPKTVMSSYNKVNGVYTACCEDLMTKILRDEWRFNGLLMTDWESCRADRADPVAAIEAGTDLLMPGDGWLKKTLSVGLKEGRLSRRSLERAAGRVLMLARRN